MQQLEYDHAIHETPNAGDDNLMVKFFIAPIEDHDASKEAGRPIFKDVEWIDIRIPGSRDNTVRPVRYEGSKNDVDRFPRHYAAFKNRTENNEGVVGTPLSVFPGVKAGQRKELEFFNIVTVEQLANAPDSAGTNFMGFNQLKQAAQEFIKDTEKNAPVVELRKELNAEKKKNADLLARLQKLEAKVLAEA